MKKYAVLFGLFLFSLGHLSAQDKEPNITINILENDNISEVNFHEKEAIFAGIKEVTDLLKTFSTTVSESQKIGIYLVIPKVGLPRYTVYSVPVLDKEIENRLLAQLQKVTLPNTKILDFPLFFSLNAENQGEITAFPEFIDPVTQKTKEYDNEDIKGKFELNKKFAQEEVLVVLGAYLAIVDDKFAGVKSMGTLVNSFETNQNLDMLTSTNYNYWRAVVEMEPANQLIPITKIAMLVAQGEIDYALKYIEIISMFSNPKTISSQYLDQLTWRLREMEELVKKEIERGIVLHDLGEYSKAIAIYDAILAQYPNSSWAIYEKYFSENALNQKNKTIDAKYREDWDKTKIEMYKHDPLYPLDVRANNGKEAYLMSRRQELNTLFKSKSVEKTFEDVIQYAKIAQDLGQFDFAAQLFWLSFSFDKSAKESSLNNFLYSLEKLGVTELKTNFKGDFKKIFAKIDAQRQKEMEKSAWYKAMTN